MGSRLLLLISAFAAIGCAAEPTVTLDDFDLVRVRVTSAGREELGRHSVYVSIYRFDAPCDDVPDVRATLNAEWDFSYGGQYWEPLEVPACGEMLFALDIPEQRIDTDPSLSDTGKIVLDDGVRQVVVAVDKLLTYGDFRVPTGGLTVVSNRGTLQVPGMKTDQDAEIWIGGGTATYLRGGPAVLEDEVLYFEVPDFVPDYPNLRLTVHQELGHDVLHCEGIAACQSSIALIRGIDFYR